MSHLIKLKMLIPSALLLAFMASTTACSRDSDLALLHQVSEIIVESHYDPDLHGLDWADINARYRKLIKGSDSRSTSLGHINAMLFELGDSHCGIGDLNDAARAGSPYIFGEASVGIDIRLIEEQAVVTRVKDGSPAANAGIRPGFTLVAIDKTPVRQIVASASLRPPYTEANKNFHRTEAIVWQLFGVPETPVALDYLDGEGNKHSTRLLRTKRLGGVELFPSLPPVFIEVETRAIVEGVNYLWFNAFQPDNPSEVLAAIDHFDHKVPLIIDLRGNNGGSANATSMLIDRFTPHRFLAYNRVGRQDQRAIYANPTNPDRRWNIVILVDELSISSAENFTAIMQQASLATVVGNRTPGQLLWGEGFELDESLVAVIPVAQLILPDGTNIEGRGVVPDLVVPLSPEDLLRGIDTQLKAAIGQLSSH
jgi:carboxyl-terminal processing protease